MIFLARVRLEAGAGSLTGFELALEDEGGEGELLFWHGDSRWPHRPNGDKRQELNSLGQNSKLAVSRNELYAYSAYPA